MRFLEKFRQKISNLLNRENDKLLVGLGIGLAIFIVILICVMALILVVGMFIGGKILFNNQTAMILIVEFVVFVILMVPILLGIAWKLAPRDMFFTTMETGDIKFVVAGDSWVRTLTNIPGKILNKDGEIEDGDSEAEKTWLQRRFGLYWIGIWPFRKIHSFSITKERENQEISQDTKPDKWIQRDNTPTTLTSLRWKFPRPVLVPDVEFQGTLRATILVLCKFEVKKPVVPIFIQKANFFELLASYVRSGVIEFCQNMTYEQFVKANKKDTGDMSGEVLDDVRRLIESEVGISLTGLAVSNYESSDKETQKIMEAKERAKLQGEADIAAAERQKQVAITEAEGKAEADKIRAVARIADITEATKQLIAQGVNPNIAAHQAGAVGRAERFTRSESKITTLVDGSGSNVAIPLPSGEEK